MLTTETPFFRVNLRLFDSAPASRRFLTMGRGRARTDLNRLRAMKEGATPFLSPFRLGRPPAFRIVNCRIRIARVASAGFSLYIFRMHPIVRIVRDAAAPFGLNLVAAIPADRYDASAGAAMRAGSIDPNCRSIVILGNGGGDFWRAFTDHAARHPGWMERENPLDDFTRLTIDSHVSPALLAAGIGCAPVFPFVGGSTLDFMRLGRLAGVAGPSIIGVLAHPAFGPWIAFRAALLLDADADQPGEAAGFDPCPSCSTRDCVAACPAGAVTFAAGWDIPRCLTHRVEAEAQCAPRCHARVECVIGREHRYSQDELAYHQERALRAMRSHYDEERLRQRRT
jgi:epoxyqueuosine reductase